MNKRLWVLLWTGLIAVSWIISLSPTITTAAWFWDQRATTIGVAWADQGWSWNEWFLDFVQTAINRILALLWLITIIILIYGGIQMVTAAWDDWKYKKWFTIVKQAIIGLILIWTSALIVNLIFNFVNTNTETTGWTK